METGQSRIAAVILLLFSNACPVLAGGSLWFDEVPLPQLVNPATLTLQKELSILRLRSDDLRPVRRGALIFGNARYVIYQFGSQEVCEQHGCQTLLLNIKSGGVAADLQLIGKIVLPDYGVPRGHSLLVMKTTCRVVRLLLSDDDKLQELVDWTKDGPVIVPFSAAGCS